MKSIYLIRHGEVDIDTVTPLTYNAFREWLQRYDRAPLKEESRPSESLIKEVQKSPLVLSSGLERSLASVKWLRVTECRQETLFNEVGVVDISVPFIKLSPIGWLTLFRLLMFIGVGKGGISLRRHRVKAREATAYLLNEVEVHGSVVLVGHGAMNYLIGKVLQKEGWQCQHRSHENFGVNHWRYLDT
jgi:broad specificity phosphatase PhoE